MWTLIKNQINVGQLLVRIRNKGCRRIHDGECAILEAPGRPGGRAAGTVT